MAAAGHEVSEPDFVYLAEVGMVDPLTVVVSTAVPHFQGSRWIEQSPADISRPEFAFVPIRRPAFSVFANKIGSVG